MKIDLKLHITGEVTKKIKNYWAIESQGIRKTASPKNGYPLFYWLSGTENGIPSRAIER